MHLEAPMFLRLVCYNIGEKNIVCDVVEWCWKAFRGYAHSARVTIFFRILVACASLLACVCLHFLIFICSFWLILYGQAESGSVLCSRPIAARCSL